VRASESQAVTASESQVFTKTSESQVFTKRLRFYCVLRKWLQGLKFIWEEKDVVERMAFWFVLLRFLARISPLKLDALQRASVTFLTSIKKTPESDLKLHQGQFVSHFFQFVIHSIVTLQSDDMWTEVLTTSLSQE
jgi:hypothetical protein